MSKALLVLSSDQIRQKAAHWIAKAPQETRVTFQGPRRSLPQNDKMWSMLTALSEQLLWHGQKWSPDDWKDYMMHSLKRARWMPDEAGGMVPVGMRTSDLSKEEMSDLIALMDEFAARNGVEFLDQK